MKKLIIPAFLIFSANTNAGDLTVDIESKTRIHLNNKKNIGNSLSVKPAYYIERENHAFYIEAIGRADTEKKETHADIRELVFTSYTDNTEVSAGIGQFFWGTVESNNIVDVINQKDNFGYPKKEKLGQPFIQFSFFEDKWGHLDTYVLPIFIPRDLSKQQGIVNKPIYESPHGRKHIDTAFRYSNSIKSFDIGFSYFKGTNRQPILTNEHHQPYYAQMKQYGIDLQGEVNNTLIKSEAVIRQSHTNHHAFIVGLESSINSTNDLLNDTSIDLITEYTFDSRDDSFFQNDLVIGSRVNFNNSNDTEINLSMSYDIDSHDIIGRYEISTRINDYITTSIDGVLADNNSSLDVKFNIAL